MVKCIHSIQPVRTLLLPLRVGSVLELRFRNTVLGGKESRGNEVNLRNLEFRVYCGVEEFVPDILYGTVHKISAADRTLADQRFLSIVVLPVKKSCPYT